MKYFRVLIACNGVKNFIQPVSIGWSFLLKRMNIFLNIVNFFSGITDRITNNDTVFIWHAHLFS